MTVDRSLFIRGLLHLVVGLTVIVAVLLWLLG
jgi:hypothetical protein